jgi:hypothetical protein
VSLAHYWLFLPLPPLHFLGSNVSITEQKLNARHFVKNCINIAFVKNMPGKNYVIISLQISIYFVLMPLM